MYSNKLVLNNIVHLVYISIIIVEFTVHLTSYICCVYMPKTRVVRVKLNSCEIVNVNFK